MNEKQINIICLNENPAFVRFLRNDVNDKNNLIATTYQLSKESSNLRYGSIYLLSNDLFIKRRIETNGGVFRFEILSKTTKVLASLTSGRISIFDTLSDFQSSSDVLSNGIILDVSFNFQTNKSICSDDFGNLILVDMEKFIVDSSWSAHKSKYGLDVCEIWCCCWLNKNKVVSGGEDGLLKIWDIRIIEKCQNVNQSHSSGVVFVNESDQNTLLTGSYDEHLRTFDIRNFSKPVLEHKLDGGVWHAEKIAGESELYSVACMYGGFAIVSKSSTEFTTLYKNVTVGQNLVYGISTEYISESKYLVAICSFNDKSVRSYEIDLNF